MTKIRLPYLGTPIEILKKPYSVEKIGDNYEYQIMTYGFEHLIPQVLTYELHHGLTHILQKVRLAPLGTQLFELPLEVRPKLDQIKLAYAAGNILDLEYSIRQDKIIITKITPLRKLLKSTVPTCVASAILAICFTGCQFNYSSSQIHVESIKLDFKKINPSVATNLKRLYPSHEGTIVQVPLHFLHFSTTQECMFYTLEYLYPNTDVAETPLSDVTSSTFSFFKLLRGLDIKEHYFLNIRKCSQCRLLSNPLSSAYSTFCKNPFECELNKGTLKSTTGWAILEDTVYIWIKDVHTRDQIKLSLETWIPGLYVKDRTDPKIKSNQIWINNSLGGSILDHRSGLYVITLTNPESLVL